MISHIIMSNPFQAPEPLLGPTVSTIVIRQWLQGWHDDHCLVFERAIKNRVAWDGRWVEENTLQELYFDLKKWGFDPATGKRIVQDIVRERDAMRERRRLVSAMSCFRGGEVTDSGLGSATAVVVCGLWFVLLCLFSF
jgi:hypothetical protein